MISYRFLRGDQYAIALALLEEGKVVLGVLACPNLPLSTIGSDGQLSYENGVGCLFSASVGSGTEVQSLDNSGAKKVKLIQKHTKTNRLHGKIFMLKQIMGLDGK